MSSSDPKGKQNTDKKEKPVEPKPSAAKPPIPERPQANVTGAQKSADPEAEKRSGNNQNG